MKIWSYQCFMLFIFLLGITLLRTDGASAQNAPDSIIAYPLSPTSVVVKWANSSPNATSFQVWESTDVVDSAGGTNYNQVQTVAATQTYCIISGLTANTGYFFQVIPAGDGNSYPINTSSAIDPVYVFTGGYLISTQQVGYASSDATVTPLSIASNATTGSFAVLGTWTGSGAPAMSQTSCPNQTAYYIAEFNSSGAMKWKGWPGCTDEYTFNGVAIDKNGNIAVTGTAYDAANQSYSDLAVSYYNSSGTNVWAQTVTETASQVGAGYTGYTIWGNAVTFDKSGTVYVTGGNNYTDENGNSINQAIIYSFAATNGTVTPDSNPTSDAVGYDIAINSSGTPVMTGSDSNNDILLVRVGISSNGSTFADSDGQAYSMALDSSDNIYVLSDSNDEPSIYKLSSAGTEISISPVNVTTDPLFASFDDATISIDSSGNWWLANDYDFREYSSSGTLLWTKYGDPNYPYTTNNNFTTPSLVSGTLSGNNFVTVGTFDADNTQFDQFEMNPLGDKTCTLRLIQIQAALTI